jgi:hypothetical protein
MERRLPHAGARVPCRLGAFALVLTAAGTVSQLSRYGLKPNLVPRSSPDVFDIGLDYRNRLTSVLKNSAAYSTYSYDVGNKLTAYRDGAASTAGVRTYSFDRLVAAGSQEWEYDGIGNATDQLQATGAVFTYKHLGWDALSRFVSFASGSGTVFQGQYTEQPPTKFSTYYYTPRGAIARVSNPGELGSSADNIYIGEWARLNISTGNWVNSIRGRGKTVAEVDGARINMPHRTLLQTVAAVSDDLGQVVRQQEYSPYGRNESGTPAGTFEEHFHGLRVDELMVAGGRAYDASVGVWLSRDKLVLTNPESIVEHPANAFMYGFNAGNPYVFRDADGQQPVPGFGFDPISQAQREVRQVYAPAIADIGEKGAKTGIAIGTAVLMATCGLCAKVFAIVAISQASNEGEALSAMVGARLAGLWGGGRGTLGLGLRRSETQGSVTNLGTQSTASNVELFNREVTVGGGMSGVFDHQTGRFVLRPSADAANLPSGWVSRYGGHADVRADLGAALKQDLTNQPGRISGFSISRTESGITFGWRSNTVNSPSHGSVEVPESLRSSIETAVRSALGQ